MATYAPTPSNSVLPVLSSGVEEQCGRRMSMEDTHVTIDDLFSVFPGLPPLPAPRAYYGVYDGHGGKQTADMVKEALHKILVNDPGFRDASDVVGALMRAYEEMDKKVLLASKDRVFTSGATAVTVVVVGNKVWVANLGDAEAVKPHKEGENTVKGKNMSVIHRPQLADERQRLEAAGCHVLFGRVLGTLAVSRAFGDIEFKHPYNRAALDFVSPVPSVAEFTLTPEIEFLVVACDGLWDRVSYDDAMALCGKCKLEGKSASETAKILVRKALDEGTMDNVTCIVIYLKW